MFAEDEELLNRFSNARADNGSLDGDSSFADSFGGLPADSLARAWVRGGGLQTAFDDRLEQSGLPADTFENQVGSLDAVTAAVTPDSDGISIASTFSGDLKLGSDNYHAELPGALPSGAIFYLSFREPARNQQAARHYASAVPNFDQQRAQIELVLGYPLEDVFALLDGEAAVGSTRPDRDSRPSSSRPPSATSRRRRHPNRIAHLAAAAATSTSESVQIGSVQAKEISSRTAYRRTRRCSTGSW